MIFGCQSSIIHTNVDIHVDIQAKISPKDILHYPLTISMNGYLRFHGYQSSIIHAFVDINLDMDMHWLAMDSRSRDTFLSLVIKRRPCQVKLFPGQRVTARGTHLSVPLWSDLAVSLRPFHKCNVHPPRFGCLEARGNWGSWGSVPTALTTPSPKTAPMEPGG